MSWIEFAVHHADSAQTTKLFNDSSCCRWATSFLATVSREMSFMVLRPCDASVQPR
jgi:hypothetical protein